jgi:hypothetical protein
MAEIEKKMLAQLGGDTIAYNNLVTFGNFLCDMIDKYGKDVLEDVKKEQGGGAD